MRDERPGHRSRRVGSTLLVLAGLVAGGLTVPPTASAAPEPLTWLALGDGFSSGEGIPGALPRRDSKGRTCARADGWTDETRAEPSDVMAWPAVAASDPIAALDVKQTFVACADAVTDDWRQQYQEGSDRTERTSWDIVSLSFGANNIGLPEIIQDCLDLSGWRSEPGSVGCQTDQKEIKGRVAMLAGSAAPESGRFQGTTTLPTLYDEVAGVVEPGGHVLVAGYPRLIEDPDRWPAWRTSCQGILDADAPVLRAASRYLNKAIKAAVEAADERWASRNVHFMFLDFADDVFETADGRHGVCTDQPGIGGSTVTLASQDFRTVRTFYPTLDGHRVAGDWVAPVVRQLIHRQWLYDTTQDFDPLNPSGIPTWFKNSKNPDNATLLMVGCAGVPALTTFAPAEGTTRMVGRLSFDPEQTMPGLVVEVVVSVDGVPGPPRRIERKHSSRLDVDVTGAQQVVISAEPVAGVCSTLTADYLTIADGYFR